MFWLLQWMLWAVTRVLLALRYKVQLVGIEKVLKKPGPYLIMPNHPAFTDPPNLLVRLWPYFRMRPLLLETNFRSPLFAPLAWILRGIYMPDIVKASAEDKQRAEAAVGEVIATLRAGQNVILWPSGRLERDGVERLGGARTAADVLAAVPEVTVVLVRTRGLYGSMFSWADGQPSLLKGFLRGLGLWAANLFFFAPRRKVTVTLEAFGPEERPAPAREAVNRWLEQWYNADMPREQPTFVPRHFLFGSRTHEYPQPVETTETFDLSKVKPETKVAVAHLIEEKLKRPLAPEENNPDLTIVQLGIDSIDAMDVALAVERRFGFSSDTVPTTLGGLWALAEGLHESAPPKPPPAGWFDLPPDDTPLSVTGEIVPEAVLNQAFARPNEVIVADDLAGGVTYEKFVVGAWAMASRFRAIEAPHVGLMLPASAACDIALVGLLLAGKLPVLLNWTTGPANLTHAAKLMELTHVVTSKTFIDRTQVQVPGAKYLFLEDVRASFGKLGLLRRLVSVRYFGGWVKKRLLNRLPRDPHTPAVVLFTSGSEKAPKAVPLTHNNLLFNQRAALQALQLSRHNSAISFLPMFHSFGLNVVGLLPLCTGLRMVHHPDPTDAGALIRKIISYKTTIVAGTPTFVNYILERAKPGDLDCVRLFLMGAEKCPQAVFDKVKQLAPQAEALEGYGITECSPVVAVNRPGRVRLGTMGEPLPGVDVCATDLNTNAVLPRGQMGMLHVAGPTIFPGYIGYDGPQPFAEFDGKKWYITGDLGELDEVGAIVFRGRLKRFLKAGGEMISLPALEEPFARKFPATDQGPRVAVEGVDTPTGRCIVLFTTEPITLREANAILQTEGFHGVMRLDDVKQVEKIPTLGTGKTDYKVLRAMIAEGK
ncbi:MAG: AMP-binding protein [Planctomycetia bacterium]|nr:AMP-binding protein [Planctomycetia bacterium]